ncbi:mevalonate kinase-like [Nylanderia fulva]|uniref:mevalonate kinase-like n=1 Tax=Nylanderia fulva TaxID=613905 RepID=UPI0010FB2159|nr:mevalonate kinase-like [Nylanderia fulva]
MNFNKCVSKELRKFNYQLCTIQPSSLLRRRDIFIKMERELINFKISAPGRIVLSGEHLAMYERHFVVAGLDLRTKLEFCELPETERIIRIEFSRVDLQCAIPLAIVESYFFHPTVSTIKTNPVEFLKYVKFFIDQARMWNTCEQRFSLQIFFYLLCFMTNNLERRPFHVRVSTEIPFGSGLGSSTSFAGCLAACFLHWERRQKSYHIAFNNWELDEIEQYAKSCENVMQDNIIASIDAKICLRGGIKKCRRTNYQSHFTETIDFVSGLRILLINTNISQNKEQRAQQMVNLRCKNLIDFFSLLYILDAIAKNIWDKLNVIRNNSVDSPSCQDLYRQLENEIRRNQLLLKYNNLSDPKVDEVCSFAKNFKLNGKLTGFQGGYVYILLPPMLTDEKIEYIKAQFLEQYPNCISTTFDYDGVRIDQ